MTEHKKRNKILQNIAIVLGLLILIEAVALLRLYRNVAGFQKHWQQVAKEQKKPGDFVYLALGDSAAQGLGASHPDKGYVGLIAKDMSQQTGKSVKVINISKSGARVKDVIKDQIPKIKELTKDHKPDLVTIEIGGNDVATLDETVFRKEFTQLVSLLPEGTYVSNMPYFGSRPKSRPKAFRASLIIQDILAQNKQLNLVDLQTITQERHTLLGYAADYFHPNNRSYENWHQAFMAEINKDGVDGQL